MFKKVKAFRFLRFVLLQLSEAQFKLHKSFRDLIMVKLSSELEVGQSRVSQGPIN